MQSFTSSASCCSPKAERFLLIRTFDRLAEDTSRLVSLCSHITSRAVRSTGLPHWRHMLAPEPEVPLYTPLRKVPRLYVVSVLSLRLHELGGLHTLSHYRAPLRGRQTWHLVLFIVTAPGERNCFIARASEDSTCHHCVNVLRSWNLVRDQRYRGNVLKQRRIDKLWKWRVASNNQWMISKYTAWKHSGSAIYKNSDLLCFALWSLLWRNFSQFDLIFFKMLCFIVIWVTIGYIIYMQDCICKERCFVAFLPSLEACFTCSIIWND